MCNSRQLAESVRLYSQLLNILETNFLEHRKSLPGTLALDKPVTTLPIKISQVLHECAIDAFKDQVAIRSDLLGLKKSKRVYYCSDPIYKEKAVYIHGSSATRSLGLGPEIVMYYQIVSEENEKLFLRECFPLTRDQLERKCEHPFSSLKGKILQLR